MTTTTATRRTNDQLTLPLGLALQAWKAEQRTIISEWNARGDRYKAFVAANTPETITSFGAYIEDLTVHLDALDTPEITGLPNYNARDLLAELRNLRNLNDNVVRSGGHGIVRRAAGSARTKIRWGITSGEGSAQVYSGVTDKTAKSLAIALKKD